MDGECRTYRRVENSSKISVGEPERRLSLEDLNVNERILLK
jgi:hypothetical protein